MCLPERARESEKVPLPPGEMAVPQSLLFHGSLGILGMPTYTLTWCVFQAPRSGTPTM